MVLQLQVDATLFGTLIQFTDTPLSSDKIKPFIEQSTPNLISFLNRIKAEFWPDWNIIIEQLALNPGDIKEKGAEAATTIH